MNKFLLLIVGLMFLVAPQVFAEGPFLCTQPVDNVTKYTIWIEVDGVEFLSDKAVIAESDGSLHWDLEQANLPDGELSFVVRSGNLWYPTEEALISDPFFSTKAQITTRADPYLSEV